MAQAVGGMKIFGVDAFTLEPYRGNPAAVCLQPSPMPERWMQSVAAEMNLSETAFLVRQGDGEYALRWFTPTVEVDLCGHATLASAHVLFEMGEAPGPSIVFHTRSGALTARKTHAGIELDFPLVAPEEADAPPGLLESIGVHNPAAVMKAGPDYLVEAASRQVVEALSPDFPALRKVDMRGVIVTAKSDMAGVDFVSRFFAPGAGIDEDPVTGSAHCALAPYWAGRLGKTEFSARQVSRRGGDVGARIDGGRVALSGAVVIVWSGRLNA